MVRQLGFMVVAVVVLWGSTADAGTIRWQLTGSVDHADAGNDFGLSVTDTITGYAIFDDSVLSGGAGVVELGTTGNAFGGELSFTVGEFMFEEEDDTDFDKHQYPSFRIFEGELVNLNFVVNPGEGAPGVGPLYDGFPGEAGEGPHGLVGPLRFKIKNNKYFGIDPSDNKIEGIFTGSIDLDDTGGEHTGGERIPEPGTLALLGLGAAAAGLTKRRRQKRAAA